MIRLTFLLSGFLLFFGLQTTLAQRAYPVDEGVFQVGGNVGFSSIGGDNRDGRIFNFRFAPSGSYFIRPNLAIGGAFSFSTTSFDGNSTSALGLGPQIAYYIGDEESLLYPYFEFRLFYLTDFEDFNAVTYRPASGLAYMISRNVAINGELFFQFDDTSISDSNVFGLDIGIKVFIY